MRAQYALTEPSSAAEVESAVQGLWGIQSMVDLLEKRLGSS
jgi:hypothetical protein